MMGRPAVNPGDHLRDGPTHVASHPAKSMLPPRPPDVAPRMPSTGGLTPRGRMSGRSQSPRRLTSPQRAQSPSAVSPKDSAGAVSPSQETGTLTPRAPQSFAASGIMIPHAPHAPLGPKSRARPVSRQGSHAVSRPSSRAGYTGNGSQSESRPPSSQQSSSVSLCSRSSSEACIEVQEEFGGSLPSRMPTPKLHREELMEVPEEGITEDFLQRHCRTTDLSTVSSIDVQLDTVVQNIDCLGMLLPRLRHLKLSNSSVMSIRELGTGLDHLEVLWMSRCSLQELDGIAIISELQELYLPFNDVADVSQLKWLESLSVLDVEGNSLSTMDDLEELRRCHELRDLTISGNPICQACDYSIDAVLELLPQISTLNDLSRDECLSSNTIASSSKAVDPGIFLDMYLDSDMPLYLDLYLGHQQASMVGEPEFAGDEDGSECPRQFEDGGPRHPLMEQGLRESQSLRNSLIAKGEINEPSEQQLIQERLKRSAGTQARSAAAQVSDGPSCASSFNLQLPSRRQASGQEVATPRCIPATPRGSGGATPRGSAASPGLGLEDVFGQSPDAASDLTRGGQLAGNPLAAMRQRRNQASPGDQDTDLGIRELLRRHNQ